MPWIYLLCFIVLASFGSGRSIVSCTDSCDNCSQIHVRNALLLWLWNHVDVEVIAICVDCLQWRYWSATRARQTKLERAMARTAAGRIQTRTTWIGWSAKRTTGAMYAQRFATSTAVWSFSVKRACKKPNSVVSFFVLYQPSSQFLHVHVYIQMQTRRERK